MFVLKKLTYSIVIEMHNNIGIKHCSHEFHISSANDEPTHIATYDDIFEKPILICDTCKSLYDDYKLWQMSGIHRIWMIDEYLTSRVVVITWNHIA